MIFLGFQTFHQPKPKVHNCLPIGLLGKRKLRRTGTSEGQKLNCGKCGGFQWNVIKCWPCKGPTIFQHGFLHGLSDNECECSIYTWIVCVVPVHALGLGQLLNHLWARPSAKLLQEHVFVQQHFCGQFDHVANHDILDKRAQVFLPSALPSGGFKVRLGVGLQ